MTYDPDGHLVPIQTSDSPAGRPTVTGAVLMRPPYGTGGERWVQDDAASVLTSRRGANGLSAQMHQTASTFRQYDAISYVAVFHASEIHPGL